MNKHEVLELLKQIKYPGFSRDIVSFGMVQDVQVEGKRVTITLKITTQKEDKKQAVHNAVTDILLNQGSFENVQIEISNQDEATSVSQELPAGPMPLDKVEHIIAIASGKGGVGKSTVAANLAAALSQKGYRVGLLDLDIYGPSLPTILGFNENPELTQDKKLAPLERYGMKVMSFGFISGNNTPTIWRGPMVSRMTEQFFQDVLWGELDYLVLDLPPGTGDVQLTLTQKIRISGAIIVTTPQDMALTDVRKGADMFRKVQTPVLGVVENMAGLIIKGHITGASGDIKLDITGVDNVAIDENGQFEFQLDLFKKGGGVRESERLGVPLLGEIPLSQDLMEATDDGEPLVLSAPDSNISKIYNDIASRIDTILQS
ncbi:MAG: P-loop NTPase [Fidelibacterota bacterium]